VLVREREELPHVPRPHLAHRLDQALDDRPEQLVRLEVQRALCEPRVALVQERFTDRASSARTIGSAGAEPSTINSSSRYLCTAIVVR
jgi:hypothetical protein